MKIKHLILCGAASALTLMNAAAVSHEFNISVTDRDVEFVSVSVLNPSAFGTSVTGSDVADAMFDAASFYVSPDKTDYSYILDIGENDPKGKYTVKIAYTNTDRSKSVSETRYYENIETSAMSGILADIYGAANPAAKIKEYSDANKVVVPMDKITAATDFNTVFGNIKTEQYEDGFDSIEDFYAAIDKVFFIKDFATSASDDLELYMNENAALMSEEITTYNSFTDEEKAYAENIYKDEKATGAQSMGEITKKIRRSLGMSVIKYGTYEEKAQAFEDYADDFGIDVAGAKANGVSLAEVAQLISGDTPAEVKASFESLTSTMSSGNSGISSGTGTGSGGGGGGGSSSRGSVSFAPVAGGTPSAPEIQSSVFSDMGNFAWAIEYVEDLYEKGVVSGDGDGTYRPGSSITRAEFVKMVVVAFGYTMTGAEKEFSDSNKSNWYYPYIVTAYNNSIVTGKSENYFGANENITRQDMAVILYRVLGLSAERGDMSFADSADVAEYAADAVKTLSAKGILNGFEDGTFRAGNFASRAEAAALISRSMAY